VQYNLTGNEGKGEYYQDPTLAPTGYRPRPYTDYPYMHNVAAYVEENFTIPVGSTSLRLTAGVRMENVFINGAQYKSKSTFSPRFSGRWEFSKHFAIKGGWGITEKLPSYYILYPQQEYKDVQTFGVSYGNNEAQYLYYTSLATLQFNSDLRWQRNQNSEFGFELTYGGFNLSMTGFYNVTRHPYTYTNSYAPISYTMLSLPNGYTMPSNPEFRVDNATGMLYVRDASGGVWQEMDATTRNTFVQSTKPDNGAKVTRAGVELVADFPEIRPIRTTFRLDGSYNYNHNLDAGLTAYYTSNQTQTEEYVGIYATGGGSSVYNGNRSHTIDANITAITHIPRARLIITCRLEMSLLNHSIRLSEYNGGEYAYNVSESDNNPTGGSIYNGHSYTAIRPIYYLDLDGVYHRYTDADAADSKLSGLIRKSGNAYVFSSDGYDPYFSANISITKEIGNHVSISLFANNFTRSRKYVTSYATGVSAIFTPNFYYGLTLRIKI
ncbi:MAG: TonB-dependent receptor, partial [Bacteroidales bacterium]|nr:TonB-dependent receptor [Bacteroidales bacterium]